ncbi:MAG: FdtA/QdtA family cupin domain-containing protein, partial [Patescibacteria group bacterium]
AVRGKHAHKNLEQVIFCIQGSFSLYLDDGSVQQIIILNKPGVGVFLGKRLWHKMSNFSDHCVLLIFASDYYNESDYIRNYQEFKNYIANFYDII